jgi:hypothetical protein
VISCTIALRRDRRHHVGGAGGRQEDEREREAERAEPERGDRQRPAEGGPQHGAPRPPQAPHPAGQQRAYQGPDGRCRGKDPEPGRADAEHVQGEDGEERRRHPEDHRIEVHRERGEDGPTLAREAQAFGDPRQARAAGAVGRRDRRDGDERPDCGHEADRVERIARRDPERGKHHAADGRSDHGGGLEVQLVQGDRGRKALAWDEARNRGCAGGLVDRPEARSHERDRVDRQDRRPR